MNRTITAEAAEEIEAFLRMAIHGQAIQDEASARLGILLARSRPELSDLEQTRAQYDEAAAIEKTICDAADLRVLLTRLGISVEDEREP